jgi:hypothetical protein
MIVDDAIVLDPAIQAFICYGHMGNGFEVLEPGVDFYDIKDVPHGNVLIKNDFAKTTNSWRHIFVYTPPGYDAGAKTRRCFICNTAVARTNEFGSKWAGPT